MNKLMKAAVVGMSVLVMQSMSNAALLPDFADQQAPDLSSQFVTVTYNSSHIFHAQGQTAQLQTTSGTTNVTGTRVFDLSVELNPTTGAPVDGTGTLSITGYVGSSPSGTLLTASLINDQFGFVDGGGDEFDFYFEVTGGDLSTTIAEFAPGSQIAVRLDANFPANEGTVPNFAGSFASPFDNAPGTDTYSLNGTADTYAVPEPASVALLAIGGLLIARRRRSR